MKTATVTIASLRWRRREWTKLVRFNEQIDTIVTEYRDMLRGIVCDYDVLQVPPLLMAAMQMK